MKKILSVTIVLLFLAAMCTACGGSAPPAANQPQETAPPEQQLHAEPAETAPPAKEAPTLEQTVLLEEADVKITATGLDPDAMFGPELKLLIENNSDKNLSFYCDRCSVNGFMVDVLLAEDVATGTKSNTALSFNRTQLELSGIDGFAEIGLCFQISTSDPWGEYLNTGEIILKTSLADSWSPAPAPEGILLYEDDSFRVLALGLSQEKSLLGPSLILYAENNSAGDVTIQSRNVSLNGFSLDPIFSATVSSGRRMVTGLDFLQQSLDDNGITEFETLVLELKIFDADSWDDIINTAPITVTFQ